MTPVPQEHTTEPKLKDDSIVISGMSGMYPKANNIKEFADKLYNMESGITDANSRWVFKHLEVTQYVGIAPNLDRFDAQFFMTHYNTAQSLDPMTRKLLEHSYQAMYDAGLSPEHLNRKKIGVFIGSAFTDSEKDNLMDRKTHFGIGLLGCNKTMFANRISYWLNIKGPSMNIDDGNASSTVALELACAAIRRGDCEAAFVGGAHLCLHPYAMVHYARLGMMAQDGKTKCFCENADGSVLSDAVQVLFLQKAKDALRNYAQVVHVKNVYKCITDDKRGPQDGHYCNSETTAEFIKEFYNEIQIPPQAVEYVEGQGLGLPQSDKCELEAIAKVYCKDKQDTLLVGSVTSNIGLTLAASGITGITKILLGYHRGVLAANMNCERPRKDVAALENCKMRIITENQPFRRTYAAVHGTSMLGVNTHVLLHGCYKPKNQSCSEKTSLPYLVALTGRQEASVQYILESLKSHPIDAEEIALLHNIHSKNISGHLGRGYIILDTDAKKNRTIGYVEKVDYFNNAKRPLWFVYSGMGSQWAGMGAQLMRIPIFAAAIERCRQALATTGLDIVEVICSPRQTMFDNILHSFVGIAAIQIGLTDVLRHVGLTPDGIIGHSVGELGCAYADGTLTAEEMILVSYCRGKVSLDTPFIHGSMAAVGLGYKQILAMCPAEIDVACHNSSQSCTISGPADVMRDFVSELKAKGIFAKEVQTSNIAYHSRYIANAGPKILESLKKIIKNPRTRSKRWVSTSVPQHKWNLPLAKLCSAEYHTNNFLNPVLFEETCQLIPANAVLVEVAPCGLLQAILKRSMPRDCRYITLTSRGHPDNVMVLLQAIGSIHMEGYAVSLQALYPRVQFPVSTETPMLSHYIQWMHSETWHIPSYNAYGKKTSAICKFVKSIHDAEHKYLQGHVIKYKMCYPFAAALVAVWDVFAMHANLPKRGASITFQDVQLHAQPLLFNQKPLRLVVTLHRGTARFEVVSEFSRVISGFINKKPQADFHKYEEDSSVANESVELTAEDIYQLLEERGYNYSGNFKSAVCASMALDRAALIWADNWVTFIDGLLQLNLLRRPPHLSAVPIWIKRLHIDIEKHCNNHIYQFHGGNVMKARVLDEWTRCGGVVMEHVLYRTSPPIARGLQNLEPSVTPTKSEIIFAKARPAEFKQKNKLVELLLTPSQIFDEVKAEHNDTAHHVTLECAQFGKLESLRWMKSQTLRQSKVIVTVDFVGLNTFDAIRASGLASCDLNVYGMDYSGVTQNGERVMGLVRGGAASSHVAAEPLLLWPVPEHWSLEDAATVPFAYAYAFYTLVIKGDLKAGMNILIHEGASALGQAVIAVALAHDCRVFTTVNDVTQKMFLRKRFPQVLEEHIGNAHDLTFADQVLTATQGAGCNIVIASVKGVLKDASARCCLFNGVLIDTVQIQDRDDFICGMSYLDPEKSYVLIDFPSIFTRNNSDDMRMLHEMLSAGIEAGYVVPLPRVIYASQHAPRAFTLLHGGRSCGRVLLRVRDHTARAQHRITCDVNKFQIMFWNDEFIGSRLVEALIRRGAKKLYICSTKLSSYQLFKFKSWEKLGVKLEVTDAEDLFCNNVLRDALSSKSVEGIYVVLKYTNEHKSFSNLTSALNNLDRLTRSLCHELKNFLVISTIKALGEKVYLSRLKSDLAATWLDLSNISNLNGVSGQDIMDAVDSAQCGASVSGSTRTKQSEPRGLFDHVVALADVEITKDERMDISLQQLGVKVENIPLLCAFLNTTYNISLEKWEVPLLSLQKLRELESYVTDVVPRDERGLSTLVSTVYDDELLSNLDLVVMPTLSYKMTKDEYDYHVPGQYLCIIPGIEGHHERFRLLCERLQLAAVVLQPGLDHPHETVKEIARRYEEILSNKMKRHDKFYLLGYESGVMIAHELAALLEDKGSTGTVFYVGYDPSEIQTEIEHQISEFTTEEQLQNAVVRHIYKLNTGEVTPELDVELRAASLWAHKVDACARLLLGRTAHSTQYVRALLEVTLARLQVVCRAAPPARALRSKLVVLRAASARSSPQHDAKLQRLSQQPVAVHHLQLPLSCVVQDMQCGALINQYLDDDIKKEFENKNICECYI